MDKLGNVEFLGQLLEMNIAPMSINGTSFSMLLS